MAFEGLRGSVSRGAAAGLGIRNMRLNEQALKQRGKEFDAEQAQAKIDALMKQMDDDRKQTMEESAMMASAALDLKKQGRIDTPEGQEAIKRVQLSYMGHAARIQAISEAAEAADIDPQSLGLQEGGSDFVNRNMQVFETQLEATVPDFEVITGEELQAIAPGMPEGAVVQKGSDGKLTMLFDPTENPSAKQEQFEFLLDSISGFEVLQEGMTAEKMAAGIVGGRFVTSLDPVTREASVIDKLTGETLGRQAAPPATTDVPPVVPEGIDTGAALGTEGIAKNVANIVMDAFGAGLASPKAQEATDAIQQVQTTTKLALQVAIPGRPAKDIRDDLEKLTVTPNNLLQGQERAKSRFKQMKRFIDNNIAEKETALAEPMNPNDRAALKANVQELRTMQNSYQDLLEGFETRAETAPEGITGEAAELWEFMTPEARDRAKKAAGIE